MSAPTRDVVPTASRPRAATGAGSLLRAELGRLRRRRLVVGIALLGFVALLVAAAVVFFTHSNDVAGARAQAQATYQQVIEDQQTYREQCLADPSVAEADQEQFCGPAAGDSSMTPDNFYQDPRLRADQDLPAIALGVAVAGALLMALIGATAVGADWSTRAMITLLTWQPRRLRFLATRLGAISLLAVAFGVVSQGLALALGALTVATRGTWEGTRGPVVGEQPAAGLLSADHFWRDLLSLQGRGVVLILLAAVIAASIAMTTRSTGGFLGVALGWFVIVELAGQGLLSSARPGLTQWTLTQNVAALLGPDGVDIYAGERLVNGQQVSQTIHVSNLDALWHLGLLAVVVTTVAAVLLRRRDL